MTRTQKERDAAAWVAVICILGGPISSILGYLSDDRNVAAFAFILGFALIIVGAFAGMMASGEDSSNED